jgi:uncharacterized protein YaiI (UPF0178 family)
VARAGDDVTVVFEQPPRPPIRSPIVEVAHARKAGPNSADNEIVRRLRADESPTEVRVVTSDHFLADQARFLGATVQSSESFRSELEGG